jgi:phosphatidylethanolamine/phosphatidyl-N-methylethanolamine N-methyltransferase
MKSRQDIEKRFWDKFAKSYDAFMKMAAREYPDLINLILTDLKPDNIVLEIACGTGIISLAVSHKVHQVYATDISQAMIDVATTKAKQEKIQNILFSVQDGYSLNFEDHKFDVCIIANAFHVMQEPEKVLKEIRRVLKPDGLLIAPGYCHGENLKARFVSWLISLTGFKAYHKFTIRSFSEFIEGAGFSILKNQVLKSRFPLVYVLARPV